MRVQLVDPSAFTPPYDRALAAALARGGAEVELLTSRFLYGPVPPAEGYEVRECFYRRSAARGLGAPGRRAFKLAEHLPDMLRFRRAAEADVLHYQWLTLPALDTMLLPPTRPRMDVEPLSRLAAEAPGRVRTLTRFVEDAEIPAIMRRADVVVLPYRDVEHSGVLYAALAFGKPLVLSAVGGFPEVAEQGAARLVPPKDPGALAVALAELVGDETARAELGTAAAAVASGSYSWDEAARQTLALYEELLEARA